jgi:hypothetical protein
MLHNEIWSLSFKVSSIKRIHNHIFHLHWDLSNGVVLAIDVLNHRINDGETIFTNFQVGLECNV